MKLSWKKTFTRAGLRWNRQGMLRHMPSFHTLSDLKNFLDIIHIRYCLLKPYVTLDDYPLVDSRELLPSFEMDLWEYKNLPGFSMVVFGRALDYVNEIFQYDILHRPQPGKKGGKSQEQTRNLQTVQNRLPRVLHDSLRSTFAENDISSMSSYSALLPYLVEMDRGQVIALNKPSRPEDSPEFYLAGVYASFPSDLDTEIKRYGLRINKFKVGDSLLYERNRYFVYQHLMELHGFPVAVSERRTSAALFARRLHNIGEKFIVRVLGQSDRTITTLWNDGENRRYPKVEKIALVQLDHDQTEILQELETSGYLFDPKNRVVIMRVKYRQHKFNEENVRQERALSVESQEIIHPYTGQVRTDVNILRDSSNMFLRLNDIVRGEYTGRIVYKRNEIVENTDTEEKRLKFLYAWLSKHQRRMIGYGDEFFAKISRLLDSYLFPMEPKEAFSPLHDLRQEVLARYSFIQQARKIRLLEDLRDRQYKGTRIAYAQMMQLAVSHVHELKFEIVSYFDALVSDVILICEGILNDAYLRRVYIDKKDGLTPKGMEIKKNYGKLVSLVDEFKAIRKARSEMAGAGAASEAD